MGHRIAHGDRVGRVEHPEARPSGRDAQNLVHHLRRKARSAHPQQHNIGEALSAHAFREAAQAIDLRRHEIEHAEPSEPLGDLLLCGRIARPYVETPAPQGVGELQLPELRVCRVDLARHVAGFNRKRVRGCHKAGDGTLNVNRVATGDVSRENDETRG